MSHAEHCRAGCSEDPTQEELQRNHGTTAEFAAAVWKAMPEFLTPAEAEAGVKRYEQEWAYAGIPLRWSLLNIRDQGIYAEFLTENDANIEASKRNGGWYASGSSGPWIVVSGKEMYSRRQCAHIEEPEHGISYGSHPALSPCPWCRIEQLEAIVRQLTQERAMHISPTNGRVVLYRPAGMDPTKQPFAAQIAYVHEGEKLINIGYLTHDGEQRSATSVPLIQDGSTPDGGYAYWMEDQKAQAEKAAQAR